MYAVYNVQYCTSTWCIFPLLALDSSWCSCLLSHSYSFLYSMAFCDVRLHCSLNYDCRCWLDATRLDSTRFSTTWCCSGCGYTLLFFLSRSHIFSSHKESVYDLIQLVRILNFSILVVLCWRVCGVKHWHTHRDKLQCVQCWNCVFAYHLHNMIISLACLSAAAAAASSASQSLYLVHSTVFW